MGFRVIKAYVPGFGKLDFIETKQEAKNVLEEFDFPFVRNAFLFKGGKVAKVILGDLRSLVSRRGALHYIPVLAYLPQRLDRATLDGWRNYGGYKKWQEQILLSLRKWFRQSATDELFSVPSALFHRLRILMERVDKYEERGFYITELSLNAFSSELVKILGVNPSFRSKKRIKLS